ncbi:MAG: ribonuclease P protein subunit [Candidatus Micrarchaeota archaeon]
MRKKFSRGHAFLLGELIGKKVRISKASSRSLQGKEGTIIDESKNTFLLDASGRRIVVPKKGNVFLFEPEGLNVDGSLLICRPEDRTKRLSKELHLG